MKDIASKIEAEVKSLLTHLYDLNGWMIEQEEAKHRLLSIHDVLRFENSTESHELRDWIQKRIDHVVAKSAALAKLTDEDKIALFG